MTEKHTPLPWMAAAAYSSVAGVPIVGSMGQRVCNTALPDLPEAFNEMKWRAVADAALIVRSVNALPELVNALDLQEKADEFHANCEECGGEEVPELCPVCFPLFDDARIARRAALAKVKP